MVSLRAGAEPPPVSAVEPGPQVSWELDDGAWPVPSSLHIRLAPAKVARIERAAEVALDVRFLALMAGRGNLSRDLFVLRETDESGTVVAESVPFQINACSAEADGFSASLTFLLTGTTAPDASRYFRLEPVSGTYTPARPLVQVDPSAWDVGRASVRIETPQAVWYYSRRGAAFSSLIDRNGNDWISFRPQGGSEGGNRGMPNNGHPDAYMHPRSSKSSTRVVEEGPVKATLYSESDDGLWAGKWEMYPHYAVYTQLRAHRPYWWLYEGTPGGAIDVEHDFWVRSDGTVGGMRESWRGVEQPQDWVAFADPNCGPQGRSILLVHEENRSAQNQYWLMNSEMTVFGFGRIRMDKALEGVPQRFFVALIDKLDYPALQAEVDSLLAPVELTACWKFADGTETVVSPVNAN